MKMDRFISGIAITAALVFTQSCASRVESQQATTNNSHPHQENSQHQTESNEHSQHQMHHGHSAEKTELTQAQLVAPANITTNKPVNLVINIQDSGGKAVSKFETFQTKLMHLIVVSDDLQFFDHLHPEHKGNGRFEVTANFPQAGNYTIFSDYQPTGKKEQISLLKAQVSGKATATNQTVDLSNTKTFGNTKVNLALAPATVKAGEEVKVNFNLQDGLKNRPITDLQPYLGEKGHLVIVKQSSSLTKEDYIHAHAIKNSPTGQVSFMTQFPHPGKYKVWGQFNRNGKIITADFWVNVI